MKEIIIKHKDNKRVAIYRLNNGTSRWCALNEMTVEDLFDITGAISLKFDQEKPPLKADIWYGK